MKRSLVILHLFFLCFCDYASSQYAKPNVCASFRLEHGLTHYFTKDTDTLRPSQGIYYSCDADYKTFENTWWGETSCSPDALDYTPRCIRKTECGRIPNIPHGKLAYDQYRQGALVHVYCDFGYKANTSSITCKNGQWTTPKCERLTGKNYGAPPQVENAVITEYTQEPHLSVTFQCREHFELKGKRTVYYIHKRWDKKPTCELSKSACGKPKMEITRGIIKDSKEIMDYYAGGDTVEYKCSEGFMFEDKTSAHCTDGNWIYPKCIPMTLDCGTPPQIEHAVQDVKDRYEDGEKAAYDCPAYYVKEGDLTCTRGRWTGSGKCWKPCTVDLKAMDDRNLQLKHKDTEKIYLTHKDFVEFSCKRGYRLAEGSVPLRQRCDNGEILLPVCE